MLRFGVFDGYEGLRHGISMRDGGVSEGAFESLNLGFDVGDSEENLRENYRRFCGAVGVGVDEIVVAYQAHTDKVVRVDEGRGLGDVLRDVDGFVTNVPGVALCVRFADCQGALFYDPVAGVIGAVHSGWRGNASNILAKAVEVMEREYGSRASDILVGVSPSLGPCCAEFSDPLRELPMEMHKFVSGRNVDLWECSRSQLLDAGVLFEHIEIAGRCTVCENDKFFSYRGGNKKTGHMGGLIALV